MFNILVNDYKDNKYYFSIKRILNNIELLSVVRISKLEELKIEVRDGDGGGGVRSWGEFLRFIERGE